MICTTNPYRISWTSIQFMAGKPTAQVAITHQKKGKKLSISPISRFFSSSISVPFRYTLPIQTGDNFRFSDIVSVTSECCPDLIYRLPNPVGGNGESVGLIVPGHGRTGIIQGGVDCRISNGGMGRNLTNFLVRGRRTWRGVIDWREGAASMAGSVGLMAVSCIACLVVGNLATVITEALFDYRKL